MLNSNGKIAVDIGDLDDLATDILHLLDKPAGESTTTPSPAHSPFSPLSPNPTSVTHGSGGGGGGGSKAPPIPAPFNSVFMPDGSDSGSDDGAPPPVPPPYNGQLSAKIATTQPQFFEPNDAEQPFRSRAGNVLPPPSSGPPPPPPPVPFDEYVRHEDDSNDNVGSGGGGSNSSGGAGSGSGISGISGTRPQRPKPPQQADARLRVNGVEEAYNVTGDLGLRGSGITQHTPSDQRGAAEGARARSNIPLLFCRSFFLSFPLPSLFISCHSHLTRGFVAFALKTSYFPRTSLPSPFSSPPSSPPSPTLHPVKMIRARLTRYLKADDRVTSLNKG